MTSLTEELTSDEISAVGDRIDAFIAENCEA